LQKRPIVVGSLVIVATPYIVSYVYSHTLCQSAHHVTATATLTVCRVSECRIHSTIWYCMYIRTPYVNGRITRQPLQRPVVCRGSEYTSACACWPHFVDSLGISAGSQRTNHHAPFHCNTLQHSATHCNTLKLTATRCHAATHCNTHHHTAAYPTNCRIRNRASLRDWEQIATYWNILQHTASHCNIPHELQDPE